MGDGSGVSPGGSQPQRSTRSAAVARHTSVSRMLDAGVQPRIAAVWHATT